MFYIFRQDLVHAGCGYLEENLRYFSYIDIVGLQRDDGFTTPINISNKRLISETTVNKVMKEQPYLSFGPEMACTKQGAQLLRVKEEERLREIEVNKGKKNKDENKLVEVVNKEREGKNTDNEGFQRRACVASKRKFLDENDEEILDLGKGKAVNKSVLYNKTNISDEESVTPKSPIKKKVLFY